MEIGFAYGILGDSLADQAKEMGLEFDKSYMDSFQKRCDAINTLLFAGLLTDRVNYSLTQKLHKQVIKHIAKKNNLTLIK